VWVTEFHKDGERFHAHFAVDRFIPRGRVETAWGHGFISIKRLTDLPVGSTAWDEARRAVGYVSKYVSKTFTGPQVFGRQRYGGRGLPAHRATHRGHQRRACSGPGRRGDGCRSVQDLVLRGPGRLEGSAGGVVRMALSNLYGGSTCLLGVGLLRAARPPYTGDRPGDVAPRASHC
jgi:hypothetical protein